MPVLTLGMGRVLDPWVVEGGDHHSLAVLPAHAPRWLGLLGRRGAEALRKMGLEPLAARLVTHRGKLNLEVAVT